jgi:hypothetical protein
MIKTQKENTHLYTTLTRIEEEYFIEFMETGVEPEYSLMQKLMKAIDLYEQSLLMPTHIVPTINKINPINTTSHATTRQNVNFNNQYHAQAHLATDPDWERDYIRNIVNTTLQDQQAHYVVANNKQIGNTGGGATRTGTGGGVYRAGGVQRNNYFNVPNNIKFHTSTVNPTVKSSSPQPFTQPVSREQGVFMNYTRKATDKKPEGEVTAPYTATRVKCQPCKHSPPCWDFLQSACTRCGLWGHQPGKCLQSV